VLAAAALVISFAGLGPIEIGMTERQAERASGLRITLQKFNGDCYQGPIGAARRGRGVLVTKRRIMTVGITRRGAGTTAEGIRVGDSLKELKAAYGARLHSRPAPLAGGFTIYELHRRTREVHFEVEDRSGEIIVIEAGRRPEIDFSEGCA
jgi:hypothetical protein